MNLKLPVVRLPLLLLVMLLLVVLLLVLPPGDAEEEGVIRLDQCLTDLAGDLRAVSLAARPGDGDLGVLALLRRRYGVETHVILATAGEGVGDIPPWSRREEQKRVRVAEARRAARSVGARLTWLGLPDHGITRAGEEALAQWDREDAVRRLVIALRSIRPHLAFVDLRNQERRGAAEAVEAVVTEAFTAAADPMQFPEAGPVWRLARVLAACSEDEAEISVDTGAIDLPRGISYAMMANRAREVYTVVELGDRQAVPPGPHLRHYRVAAASVEGTPDSLLAGLPLPRPNWLLEPSHVGTRNEILELLLALRQAPEAERPPEPKMEAAILAALNVTLTVSPADRTLIEDQPGGVSFSVVNGGMQEITVHGVAIEPHKNLGIENPELRPTALAPGAAVSGKFWVVPSPESLGDQLLVVEARVSVAGGELLTLPVRAHFEVLPTVSFRVEPWTRLIRPVDRTGVLQLVVTNHTAQAIEAPLYASLRGTDRVELTPPERVRVEPGDSVLVPVQIVLKDQVDLGLFGLQISYAGHYHQDIFRVADVNVPLEMRVGVVATETDAPFRALRALRILPVRLSDTDLETADLAVLDTIVIGARPFVTRPVLKLVLPRLVEFVKGGGNLFLNYSRPSDWVPNPLLPDFTYGLERVTREDAELIVTQMDNRLFNVPNKIESEDFEGWVLERGRYFPTDFSEDRYETLIRCADSGRPLQAGLLVLKLGEGLVIQSSLTWRPQWENLNPGALKFLANLVSLPWFR